MFLNPLHKTPRTNTRIPHQYSLNNVHSSPELAGQACDIHDKFAIGRTYRTGIRSTGQGYNVQDKCIMYTASGRYTRQVHDIPT